MWVKVAVVIIADRPLNQLRFRKLISIAVNWRVACFLRPMSRMSARHEGWPLLTLHIRLNDFFAGFGL